MTAVATITRIINPCALIEIGEVAILTDPYFADHRLFPMTEPIGLTPQELPPLSAILGGHGVRDHWHPASLDGFRHSRAVPVYTATRKMARQARRAGLPAATVLEWGESVQLNSDVTITCVPGEKVLGGLSRTNNYLIATPEISIFVGTEANDLDPIRRCAAQHHVDVAVLPIDGLTFAMKRLVMDASTALEATKILGASVLAPIHYSQKPVAGVLRCPSGIDDLIARAAAPTMPTITHGQPGTKVTLVAPAEPSSVRPATRLR